MKCTVCNQESPEGSIFCKACGARLELRENLVTINQNTNGSKRSTFSAGAKKWLVVAISILILLNIIQLIYNQTSIQQYEKEISALETSNNKYKISLASALDDLSGLHSQIGALNRKIQFYDRNVVFKIQGYSGYYSYDQMMSKFGNGNKTFYFTAYQADY